jgi:hypothetical protein
MRMRVVFGLVGCAVLALAPMGAQVARPRSPVTPAPTALTISSAVPFDGLGVTLFAGPFRCDADGNVFFVPYRMAAKGEAGTRDTVVRVSGDGKKTTSFGVAAALGVMGAEDSHINATALDAGGNLYVLADVLTPDGSRQMIVSFDNKGQYKTKLELDSKELLVGQLAVFASGEFLLSGRRPNGEARLVVMSPSGGSLDGVSLPPSDDEATGPAAVIRSISWAEPAADGRVYFCQSATGKRVYGVLACGQVDKTMKLVPPRRDAQLVELRVSGKRLAALYEETRPNQASTLRWIVVHDLLSGEAAASYGPVRNLLMCFQSSDGSDSFTLFDAQGGQRQLLRAAAP